MVSNNALPRALRRSLELVLVVGAARRERLLGATEGLVNILLEIILKRAPTAKAKATKVHELRAAGVGPL
jgi:hypothetical protein